MSTALMTLLRPLRAFALIALGAMALAGCHDIGFPIGPDFSIALSPPVSTVSAAAPTTAYTFTVTPLQYFTRSVTITLPAPQGFACVPASCTVTPPSYAAPGAFELTPLAATPAGTYAFNFFATSGSLSHEVTAMITITPAGPPTPDFTLSVSPLASTTVAVRTLAIPDTFTGYPATLTNAPSRLLAVNPAGQQIIAATSAGISIFTYPADPLSVATATVASGQLALLGSGFDKASTLTIDTLPTPIVFDNSTELTAALPPLPSGVHSVTVTAPNQPAYTLSLAFTTP